jgi:segregation and condensation protein B
MDNLAETGLVESVLYLENEPINLHSLSKITKLTKTAVLEAIEKLKGEYGRSSHGLEIVETGGGFCFSPKEKFSEVLKETYGSKYGKRLSRAALETLSIIAYSQPVTRSEIERIRGVSADGMIRLLAEAVLIKEVGKKDSPGRPVQYGTTKEFLVKFRLASIANLPKMDDTDRERFNPYDR